MRIRSTLTAILLLAASAGAHALDADELIAKNIEAKGGREALAAIQSLRSKGKMTFSGDFSFELALDTLVARPGRVRNEASVQGLTAVQAYDGKEAWQIQPFQGRKDPQKLPEEDARDLVDGADIDGDLVDYAAKGSTVEYLGTEDVDGTEAHKLKLTQKNGDVKYYYLDPDYFLEIRVTTQRTLRGAEVVYETDIGNYEKVAGVYMPFSLESGGQGGPKRQKITIESVEVNVPVDEKAFAFPATPPAK
jgi:outer membrane lipoprotein-sorting protein